MSIMVGRFVRLAIAVALVPIAVQAQQSVADNGLLEDVLVTAQKREESLRDVPLSVEAVSGEKLADAGIVRLDDLKAYVPNLQVTETGIANNFYIRGIGSGLNQGFEQSVSTYMDGVYRGRGQQSRMPFLDLARVEVLRGPQPILFGKNAVAGAVNMVAAAPTKTLESSLRMSYEVENQEIINNFMLSGPLTDGLLGRVAVYHRDSAGYVRNATLNRDEPQREELAGRIMLAKDLTDSVQATLRVEAGKFNSVGRQVEIFGETPIPIGAVAGLRYSQVVGGPVPALPQGQHASARDNVLDYSRSSNGDSSDNNSFETALTLNYFMPSDITLTSITGYSHYTMDELCDCDFTGATIFTARIAEQYDQYSQELRFTSGTTGRFSWIGGLFFQRYELDETDSLHVPTTSLVMPVLTQFFLGEFAAGRPSPCNSLATCAGAANLFRNTANPRVFTQNSTLYSAFAQGTWKLGDAWSLTAGGRFTNEKKAGTRTTSLTSGIGGPTITSLTAAALFNQVLGIQPHSLSGKLSESTFSPLVNLQFRFVPETMAYLSFSRGHKSGGFDARSNRPPATVPPVNPLVPNGGSFQFPGEEATNYEMGVKSGLGGTAEINANVFFTDYKKLQTTAFDGAIGFNVGNGTAEVKGAELAGRWRATPQLRFSGSLAYLDFEWKRYNGQTYYDNLLLPGATPNTNYAGRTNQLAPKFTGYLSAEYSWQLSGNVVLSTTADVVHSSKYLQSLNLDPVATQAAYSKLNARLALRDSEGLWELALVGRNLADKTTVSYAGDTPLAFRLFRARSYYGFVDPPRSIAIEARLNL
ncbi:MAG: TonB-dependent receptor [Steroidobacteraceae bacterium]